MEKKLIVGQPKCWDSAGERECAVIYPSAFFRGQYFQNKKEMLSTEKISLFK